MDASDTLENPILRKLVDGLVRTLGDRLHSVVLYGSTARGDFQKRTSDFNLIIVLRDLDPASLEALAPTLTGWQRRGRPMPRLFSPALIADAADVFPIEFLDIQACRVVLHGPDAFAEVVVHHDQLRLQCERELREKMMRFREGVVESARQSTSDSSLADHVLRHVRGAVPGLPAPARRRRPDPQ